MSHKSHPGDGTQGQGVKGGGVYGAHYDVAPPGIQARTKSFVRALLELRRSLSPS